MKAMNLHLKEISSQVAKDAIGAVILDGAAWHKTKKLEVPENVVLMFLPPYSPELNPVERIWRFLRNHYLSNRIFPDVDGVIAACLDAWSRFISEPERIASLCSVRWAEPASVAYTPAT